MQTMEERIEAAIINRFFEPQWIASPGMVTDPSTGAVRTETVMSHTPSEMSNVASAIYQQARAEIVRKVLERLDIDAIVAQWAPVIAKDVVSQLQVKQDSWRTAPNKTERDKMMEKVYEQVAAEFGRQCVEHIKNTGGLMAVLEA